MRALSLLALLTACTTNTGSEGMVLPDAYGSCGIGAFEIDAPRANLQYAPSMIVYINEIELWASLDLTMTDDLGHAYQWTSDGAMAYTGDDRRWWSRDSFNYELAPSRHYTLVVSHNGCTEDIQSVTFYTRAP